jgi:hypothetical protein
MPAQHKFDSRARFRRGNGGIVAAHHRRVGVMLPNGGDNGADRGAVIENAGRLWTIGAIHGDVDHLCAMHDALAGRIEPDDRLVYLGDFLGYGPEIIETVDELLHFRATFLARPPFVHPANFICLRGQQEEVWQKLLQLQFAVNPVEVLEWAFAHGADATLRAYGGDPDIAIACARGGPLALTRWAGEMRNAMRAHPGHMALMSSLRRSVWTDDGGLLFVNAGIDPDKPVARQSDAFWWGNTKFDQIDAPYAGFRTVVRGLDPVRRGFAMTPWTLTVDGGCGAGGNLMAVCLAPDGQILDRLDR